MSEAFQAGISSVQADAVKFAEESLNEYFDSIKRSREKIDAGTYGADDFATDMAAGATNLLKSSARGLAFASQVMAAFAELNVPVDDGGNGDPAPDENG